jgi:hypothetical protein
MMTKTIIVPYIYNASRYIPYVLSKLPYLVIMQSPVTYSLLNA